MTNLDESAPKSERQTDAASWLFAAIAVLFIGVAAVATYVGINDIAG